MAKYKKALIVGRFQPFHLGHKYLIDKALEFADTVIIAVGSSNIKDDKNPYSFKTRKSFVQEFIIHEKLNSKVLDIISIEDVPDDDEWFGIIEKKVKDIDVVVGDNDWVNGTLFSFLLKYKKKKKGREKFCCRSSRAIEVKQT
jgi:cytidyltransferase-like protein